MWTLSSSTLHAAHSMQGQLIIMAVSGACKHLNSFYCAIGIMMAVAMLLQENKRVADRSGTVQPG